MAEAVDRICQQYRQLGLGPNSSVIMTMVKAKLPNRVLQELTKAELQYKRRPEMAGRPWGMQEMRAALGDYLAIDSIQLNWQTAPNSSSVRSPPSSGVAVAEAPAPKALQSAIGSRLPSLP
jgi:hypothetical protein